MKFNTITHGLIVASISVLAMNTTQAAEKTAGKDVHQKHADMMAKGASHESAQVTEDKDKVPSSKATVQMKKHDEAMKAGKSHTEAEHAGH